MAVLCARSPRDAGQLLDAGIVDVLARLLNSSDASFVAPCTSNALYALGAVVQADVALRSRALQARFLTPHQFDIDTVILSLYASDAVGS